jgi:DNA repair exonuclease SbcCD ATPase subunit
MNKLSEIEIIYNDVLLIKDALDPKKGIPVVFANEYLKSIATNTNKLLKIAYGEKFKIRFNITSTDFLVEVYKNDGTFLTDIKQASQGETSLTNVSLSLAMLECMIKKYNIIYLDEVDCTLSTENRKLFIELLEKQIDELNIEQCFVISHNNEFYDKNIDLILLEGHDCPLDDKEFMQGKNVILNLE